MDRVQCFSNYLCERNSFFFFLISNLSQTNTFVKYNESKLLEKWNLKTHKGIQNTNSYSLSLYSEINLHFIRSWVIAIVGYYWLIFLCYWTDSRASVISFLDGTGSEDKGVNPTRYHCNLKLMFKSHGGMPYLFWWSWKFTKIQGLGILLQVNRILFWMLPQKISKFI